MSSWREGNQFVVGDIGEAAAHLEAAGIEFPQDQDFATFVFFDDPDGNTRSIQQGRRNAG